MSKSVARPGRVVTTSPAPVKHVHLEHRLVRQPVAEAGRLDAEAGDRAAERDRAQLRHDQRDQAVRQRGVDEVLVGAHALHLGGARRPGRPRSRRSARRRRDRARSARSRGRKRLEVRLASRTGAPGGIAAYDARRRCTAAACCSRISLTHTTNVLQRDRSPHECWTRVARDETTATPASPRPTTAPSPRYGASSVQPTRSCTAIPRYDALVASAASTSASTRSSSVRVRPAKDCLAATGSSPRWRVSTASRDRLARPRAGVEGPAAQGRDAVGPGRDGAVGQHRDRVDPREGGDVEPLAVDLDLVEPEGQVGLDREGGGPGEVVEQTEVGAGDGGRGRSPSAGGSTARRRSAPRRRGRSTAPRTARRAPGGRVVDPGRLAAQRLHRGCRRRGWRRAAAGTSRGPVRSPAQSGRRRRARAPPARTRSPPARRPGTGPTPTSPARAPAARRRPRPGAVVTARPITRVATTRRGHVRVRMGERYRRHGAAVRGSGGPAGATRPGGRRGGRRRPAPPRSRRAVEVGGGDAPRPR